MRKKITPALLLNNDRESNRGFLTKVAIVQRLPDEIKSNESIVLFKRTSI